MAGCGAWWSEKDCVPSASMGYQQALRGARGTDLCMWVQGYAGRGDRAGARIFMHMLDQPDSTYLQQESEESSLLCPPVHAGRREQDSLWGGWGVKEPESRWGGVWEGLPTRHGLLEARPLEFQGLSSASLPTSLHSLTPPPTPVSKHWGVITVSSIVMGLRERVGTRAPDLACLRTGWEVFPINLGVFNESFTTAKWLNQRLTRMTGSTASWQQMRGMGSRLAVPSGVLVNYGSREHVRAGAQTCAA